MFSATVVWVLSSLRFVLLYVWPLDPAAAVQAGMGEQDITTVRASLGLNDPLLTQYGEFMTRGLTFDFSESWVLSPDDELDKYIRMHERRPRTLWVTALAIPVALATVWVPEHDEGRLSLWRPLGRSRGSSSPSSRCSPSPRLCTCEMRTTWTSLRNRPRSRLTRTAVRPGWELRPARRPTASKNPG